VESIDTEQSSTPTIQGANTGQESVSTPPAKPEEIRKPKNALISTRELLDEKVTV
jgi:hypothetical protein